MENIVPQINDKKMMTTREIAELTGKRHDNVLADVRKLIEQGAIGLLNFQESSYRNAQNKEQPMYSLDFDATMTLVTGYDAVLRSRVIRRWRELETGAEQPALTREQQVAQGMIAANAIIEEQKQTIVSQSERIEEMKPKALFADAVAASKTCILVGELAKILKQNGVEIGQKRLFAWLREHGYLIRREGTDYNMPTQRSMERGLFEIKMTAYHTPDGVSHTTKTVKVTGKGSQYFVNIFLKELAAEPPAPKQAALPAAA